jgi:(4-(4-[2-(gamma-L-glutamylamino)ethyl]phenoxymethyl)furan-2-yl)methanamine synthase
MSVVIGWDIGGAHLKAARAEGGRIVEAVQVASPLRFGLERLGQSFAEAKAAMGSAGRHVVTMTGELADTFESRADGVAALAAVAVRELGRDQVTFYGGRSGWIAPDAVDAHAHDIASANWHASAALVARRLGTALFMDMGSTTTDIIPVVAGAVAARGYTDAERLSSGELVYTGLVRSFVMATSSAAPFAGRWTGLVHENFANLGDVHRILGTLPDGADQMMTADGRDKTLAASRARLARMVGRDVADAGAAAWTGLARFLAEAQIRAVHDGAMLVLSSGQLGDDAPIVGAGSGAAVLREVARRLGRAFRAFDDCLDAAPAARSLASQCAPAAALAALAADGRLA